MMSQRIVKCCEIEVVVKYTGARTIIAKSTHRGKQYVAYNTFPIADSCKALQVTFCVFVCM